MIAVHKAEDRPLMNFDRMLNDVQSASSQFDILRFLKKATELYGARNFIVLKVPPRTATALQSASVITNWPSELLSKYDDDGLFAENAAIRHLRVSSLPTTFDMTELSKQRTDGTSEAVAALFARFRMPRGAFFPTCNPAGERGGIGFSGDREPFTNVEMLELHMICTHVFDRLYQVGLGENRIGSDLTAREIDCLNWTAAGKTSVEISNILGLSEHTVNHYLNRVTKKLKTVNRTQAVAKALRIGIIS